MLRFSSLLDSAVIKVPLGSFNLIYEILQAPRIKSLLCSWLKNMINGVQSLPTYFLLSLLKNLNFFNNRHLTMSVETSEATTPMVEDNKDVISTDTVTIICTFISIPICSLIDCILVINIQYRDCYQHRNNNNIIDNILLL